MESTTLKEKSFMHILNVINYLPINRPWNKLKLEYASRYHTQEDQERLPKHQEFERTLTNCPTCCIPFNDETKIVRVVPEYKRRFAKRLLKGAQNNKPLTKYQSKYLKKMDRHLGNKLIIKCAVCKNEVTKNLSKPVKKIEMKSEEPTVKNKKKRRKDKFSGLNQKAVLATSAVSEKPVKVKTDTEKVAGMKNCIKNKIIERKRELLKQEKQKAKSKLFLEKLSATLNNNKKHTPKSDLNSFLSSL